MMAAHRQEHGALGRAGSACRVLVTGGAGFIGSHAVDRLVADGARVVVVDDFSSGRQDNLARWVSDSRVQIVRADISDGLFAPLAGVTSRNGGFDVLVHLAAQISVVRSVENPLTDIRVNYTGTAQILEYARCTGIRKIVFGSSSAVYGNEVGLPVAEDAARRPLSPYGVNKLAGEELIRYYGRVWGLPSTIFRFFNVYGPRQNPGSPYSGVVSNFLSRAIAGQPLTIYGDGEQTRDFIFVEDVARAISDACLKDVARDAVINLGTGIETSVNELARLVLDITGAGGGLANAPARAGEARRSVASVRRARDLLDLGPPTSLSDGLRRTLDWVRRAGEQILAE